MSRIYLSYTKQLWRDYDRWPQIVKQKCALYRIWNHIFLKDFHNNLTIHNKWVTKSIVVASCNGFDQILYSRTYIVNIIMKGKISEIWWRGRFIPVCSLARILILVFSEAPKRKTFYCCKREFTKPKCFCLLQIFAGIIFIFWTYLEFLTPYY